jgi:hypothetical protein
MLCPGARGALWSFSGQCAGGLHLYGVDLY